MPIKSPLPSDQQSPRYPLQKFKTTNETVTEPKQVNKPSTLQDSKQSPIKQQEDKSPLLNVDDISLDLTENSPVKNVSQKQQEAQKPPQAAPVVEQSPKEIYVAPTPKEPSSLP